MVGSRRKRLHSGISGATLACCAQPSYLLLALRDSTPTKQVWEIAIIMTLIICCAVLCISGGATLARCEANRDRWRYK